MSEIVPALKSEEERIFWSFINSLPDFIEEFRGMTVSHAGYESITFHVGKVSYTPDFVVILWDPEHESHLSAVFEIKGSKKQKGYAETRQRMNASASVFTEHVFVECLVDRQAGLPSSFEFIRNKPFFYLRNLTS